MHHSKLLCTLESFITILLLVGCKNFEKNISNGSDKLAVRYNEYGSYDELTKGLSILNINNPENETFLFDVKIDGFLTNYYVAGIDYRFLNPNFELDDSINSEYLKTREVFYELVKETNDLIITIVFKVKVEFDKNNLYWTSERLSFNGTTLNYETNASGDSYYLRFNNLDLLALKSNKINNSKEVITSIQDRVLQIMHK